MVFKIKKIFLLIIVGFIINYVAFNDELIVIPKNSIRFRIVANSNSSKDQNNKLIIKKELTKYLENKLKNKKNINDVNKVVVDNYEDINNKIFDIIKTNNMNYSYKVNYGDNYFPEKTYKGVKYNSGNYKSLVVTLGNGEGDNFWCVLFPPICNIDTNYSNYKYKFLIKEIVNS